MRNKSDELVISINNKSEFNCCLEKDEDNSNKVVSFTTVGYDAEKMFSPINLEILGGIKN